MHLRSGFFECQEHWGTGKCKCADLLSEKKGRFGFNEKKIHMFQNEMKEHFKCFYEKTVMVILETKPPFCLENTNLIMIQKIMLDVTFGRRSYGRGGEACI